MTTTTTVRLSALAPVLAEIASMPRVTVCSVHRHDVDFLLRCLQGKAGWLLWWSGDRGWKALFPSRCGVPNWGAGGRATVDGPEAADAIRRDLARYENGSGWLRLCDRWQQLVDDALYGSSCSKQRPAVTA